MEILKGWHFFQPVSTCLGFLFDSSSHMVVKLNRVVFVSNCHSVWIGKRKDFLGGMCKTPVSHRYWITAEKSSWTHLALKLLLTAYENYKLKVKHKTKWYWYRIRNLIICQFWGIKKNEMEEWNLEGSDDHFTIPFKTL